MTLKVWQKPLYTLHTHIHSLHTHAKFQKILLIFCSLASHSINSVQFSSNFPLLIWFSGYSIFAKFISLFVCFCLFLGVEYHGHIAAVFCSKEIYICITNFPIIAVHTITYKYYRSERFLLMNFSLQSKGKLSQRWDFAVYYSCALFIPSYWI